MVPPDAKGDPDEDVFHDCEDIDDEEQAKYYDARTPRRAKGLVKAGRGALLRQSARKHRHMTGMRGFAAHMWLRLLILYYYSVTLRQTSQP